MGIPAGTRITWYGHSCFEITTPRDRTVIIDPWFGNPSRPTQRTTPWSAATCCS